MVKLVFLVLVDILIGIVVALYLTIRLTLYTLLMYFDYTSIISSPLHHSSVLFTSLDIIGSFRLSNKITVVN